jgi:hypothetical protein
MSSPTNPPPLLSLRTAVVLFMSTVVGAGAGVATYVEHGPVSPAVAAVSAFAGATLWLHKLVGS